MVVMGEWRITQPAVRERSIISSFTTVVKQDPDMQLAFENLRDLALESFMNWYIRFALGQDVKALFNVGKQFVTNHFEGLGIDLRVLNNLAIFYVGYMLFNEFAKENGIVPPVIDMKAIMEHQLEEITGNKTGQVQSSVDQLVEALSAMAADTGILADYDFRIFEDKKIGVKGLAIPIKDIMPSILKNGLGALIMISKY